MAKAFPVSSKKPSNNLGAVLQKWRLMNMLGMREAAKLIGISSATYARIEWGYSIEAKTLMIVFNWFLKEPPAVAE